MAKISILMNCYNGEKYLIEAIDSVIAQTYADWELVFWDNCSTDQSAVIAKSYNDDRIRYIKASTHTSLGEARNLALSVCGGEFIAFLDTDDIWLPKKLELQLAIMQPNSEFALCYGDFEKIDENGQILSLYKTKRSNGYIFDKLLVWAEIGMPTVLIRFKALDAVGAPHFDPSLSFSPDYDLFMRIAAKYPVCSIKEPIAKYRITSNSLTHKTKARHWKELTYSLIKLEGLYPEVYVKFKSSFEHAYKWAAMQRADYLILCGDIYGARTHLKEAVSLGKKHRAKYLISMLPSKIAVALYKKYFNIG